MHLEPDSTKRVLHKKPHHPTDGEKLGDGGNILRLEFFLVLPCGGKRVLQFLGAEALIDPADGFLVSGLPSIRHLNGLHGFYQFFQDSWARAEAAGQSPGVEEHRDLGGKLGALPEKELPVSGIHRAFAESIHRRAGRNVGETLHIGEPEDEGVRFGCSGHDLLDVTMLLFLG